MIFAVEFVAQKVNPSKFSKNGKKSCFDFRPKPSAIFEGTETEHLLI